MSNMAAVIVPKSDQINADDLIAGPMTITITDVKVQGGQEQPVSIYFEGSTKAYRPCKSMSRVLVAAWGPDANLYAGRTLELYRDPSVKWGGMAVGGIRIGAMSHMKDDKDLTLMLTQTKQNRAPHRVRALKGAAQDKPKPAADAAPKITPEQAVALAEAAAKGGKDRFIAWFNSAEGKDCRKATTLDMEALKTKCAEADAALADDPFGLPSTDPAADDVPTPEQIAAAEEAARQAAARSWADQQDAA